MNNDYILNPELSWVKVPERLTFTTAFLKISGDVRAIAVYVTGIGHAASENDPIIDATLPQTCSALRKARSTSPSASSSPSDCGSRSMLTGSTLA